MTIKIINNIDELLWLHKNDQLEGLYKISDEIYFHEKCPGISRSMLNNMRISAKYYKIREFEKNRETEAMRFGKMLHLALENINLFERLYRLTPKFTGPRGGELRGEKLLEAINNWEFENDCKAINYYEKTKIKFMTNTINNNYSFKKYFPDPEHEIAIFVREPQYNFLLKGKVDLLQMNSDKYLIGDFKSCQPLSIASQHNIQRMICDSENPLYYQSVFYIYLFSLLNIESEFKFIFIEKDLPFGMRLVNLDDDFYSYGIEEIFSHLGKLDYAIKNNSWSCYESELNINYPNYLNYK